MTAPTSLPDRIDRAADVGMWLFIASLAMFMASLVSGYVLLRAGSESWPSPWVGSGVGAIADPGFRLIWLAFAAGSARAAGRDTPPASSWLARYPLPLAALAGAGFVARTWSAGQALMRDGHSPASHVAPATWFALNGVLAVLALGGMCATIAITLGVADPLILRRRARLLARFWIFMAVSFAVIVAGMYLG